MENRSKTVLITGGTSGIGYALAKKFAREGYSLVLVASNAERLEKAKRRIRKINNTTIVETIAQDLSMTGAAQQIYQVVKERGIVIDVLVNNAGFGLVGEAVWNDRKKEEGMLRINIQTMTQLCTIFQKEMYQRKQGKILNVASVGAFMPGPYTAAYYATKAYVASYSRAIRYEAAKYGVQVCTLYPGTTRTKFFDRAGSKTPAWAMSPDKVAECAYRGLMRNKEMIIPGVMNKLLRLVPTKVKLIGVAVLKK